MSADSLSWTRDPPPGDSAASWPGPAAVLARELDRAIEGEVGFDRGSRATHSTDASNYRQIPIGVVWPKTIADVEATLAVCRRFDAPVVNRGGATSLAGQCCNLAVVIDFSRFMNRVLEIDPERRLARVEPGCVLDTLRDAAAEHDLTFGPDPATHDHCTLGGMLGNNSCGVHSILAGRTVDNVRSLDIVLYDGTRMTVGRTSDGELAAILGGGDRRAEIYRRLLAIRERWGDEIRRRFPELPRRVSGYNLDELLPERGFDVARALVGSESTLVTIVGATLELVPWPRHRALVVVGCEDIHRAADLVPEIMEQASPIGLEGLDQRLIADQRSKHMHPADLRLLPEGAGWLLVEMGGDEADAAVAAAREVAAWLGGKSGVVATGLLADRDEQARMWEVRESGLGATARIPRKADTWPGWEDSAVPPERLGDYMRELRALLERHGYDGDFYGHFGHGCLHTRITFDLVSRPGLERYRAFLDEAADLVVRYGGSLSGEHGDGQARGELLPRMFGNEICAAFREMKHVFDPAGRMNPGKVVDPYPILANLRLGADYHPWEPETEFRYPDDERSFSRAVLRCVGVGKCRRESGGTMCPSYMVTHEEQHSTRGRARLLFEMLQGDVVADGWRSAEVEEALDLCLACKGCKHDCPVDVDMATYKAEFLAHRYRRRLRPPAAYSMGLIYWSARLASRVPTLANALLAAPLLGRLARFVGGISQERRMPSFARRPFRQRFAERRPGPADEPGRPRVLLFPDTFNNFFHPETAEAAVEVLEAAGYRVEIPPRILCCGRPLYDFGMLDLARRQLRQILEVLRPAIRDGIPLVGLEPSCVATFRDELPNLFPDDEDASRLRHQTFTLGELLRHDDWTPPRLERRALVHGHCHHKSVLDFAADRELLAATGLEMEVPDSGCCGMAGSFGFERGKVDVSLAVGERVLLPAVRRAERSTLIVTDGFSCREQIEQATDRRGLHTAQVLAMALREGADSTPGEAPERAWVEDHGRGSGRAADLLTAGSLIAAIGFLFWRFGRRHPAAEETPPRSHESDPTEDDDASQSPE